MKLWISLLFIFGLLTLSGFAVIGNSSGGGDDDVAWAAAPVTVQLSTNVVGPTSLTTVPFTVQFSESVTQFDAGDIEISSGVVENFVFVADSGLNYDGSIGLAITTLSNGTTNVCNLVDGDCTSRASQTSRDGGFNGPNAIMQHSDGNIYVSDTDNDRIQVFDGTTHAYISQFGSRGSGNGQFSDPSDIMQHTNGDIYVVDTGNRRVQIFDGTAPHAFKAKFGSAGLGDGQFRFPRGIMQHTNGDIYVTDSSKPDIQIFDGTSHAYKGKFGGAGSVNGDINSPRGIMQHSNGDIYVVSSGNARVVTFDGTSYAFKSQFGSVGSTDGQFVSVRSIMQHSNGDIYVTGIGNHNIQIFDGTSHAFKAKIGSRGNANGQFEAPEDIMQHSNGDLYITDTGNDRVQTFRDLSNAYTFNVSNPNDGQSLVVNIPEGVAQNETFGANLESNYIELIIDRTPPTVGSLVASSPTVITLRTLGSVFGSNITPSDFTITSDGPPLTVSGVTVSGDQIVLTPNPPIIAANDNIRIAYSAGTTVIEDAAGNALAAFDARLVQRIIDFTAPSVTITSTASDPTNSNVIQFTAQFSKDVSGFDASDIIASSGTVQNLTPASPSPPAVSSYTFEVANPTDQSTLNVRISAGAAQDFIPLDSVASDNFSIGIDRTAPTLVITAAPINPATPNIIPLIAQFSENVSGFDVFDIGRNSGTRQNLTPASPSPPAVSLYTFEIANPTNGQLLEISISGFTIQDAAGNRFDILDVIASFPINIGTPVLVPVVVSATTIDTTTIAITISESVTGTNVTPGDFTITNVGSSPTVSAVDISGSTVTLTLSAAMSDSDTAAAVSYSAGTTVIADGAGNALSAFTAQSITNNLDTTAPTVVLSTTVPDSTVATTIPFTVQFSENVSGFDASDIILSSGTLQNLILLSLPSAASLYAFEVTNLADQDTLTVSIPAGATQDTSANNNVASDTVSLDIDRVAPIVLSATVSNARTIIVTFSEPVFAPLGLRLSGGFRVSEVELGTVISNVDISGSIMTLTTSRLITSDYTPLLSYTAATALFPDAAGNRLAAFSDYAISSTVDLTRPVVTIATSASNPTNLDPIPFTIEFSEQVTGFAADDITTTSGTVQNLFPTPSMATTSYTFVVAGPEDGDVLDVYMDAELVRDANANTNTESSTVSILVDRTAPTISTIFFVEGDATSIRLETTEPVYAKNIQANRFTIDDITSSLTVDAVDITNGTNTITITLSAAISNTDAATATISFVSGANDIIDAAGNVLAAFDDTPLDSSPFVSLETSATSPTDLNPIPFTAQFSVGVTGFTAGDISATSGTIQNFNSTGRVISHLGTPGKQGLADGQLARPYDIAINSTGYIYVVGNALSRVQIFDSDFEFVAKFGRFGTTNGLFSDIFAIAIDSNDEIYIVDKGNSRIQKFSSDGTYQSQFGVVGSDPGNLDNPTDIAINSTGYLYVTDGGNNRVQIFDSDGTYQAQFESVVDGTRNGAFNAPQDITIDSDDNIYVSEGGNTIRVFTSNGTYRGPLVAAINDTRNVPFSAPDGVALDSDGNIYVVNYSNDSVYVLGNDGTYQTRFGSTTEGVDGEFRFPQAIAIDSDDNVYVVASFSGVIQKFSSSPPSAYSFEVSDSADQDTLTVSIPADVSQDSNDNTNRASNVISLDIDRVAPTVSSITTGSTTSIIVEVSEMIPSEIRVTSSGFTVSDVATAATVTAVNIFDTTITLTLSASMTDSDSPSLTYAADPSNPIADAVGNALASFSSQSVTNNLDTTIPIVSAISVAEGGAPSIQLEISEPIFADNISPGRFTIGDITTPPTVTAVDITNGTTTITLTLSAAISDADTATVTVSFASGATDIIDAAGNVLVPFSDAPLDPSPVIFLQTSATSPTNLDPIPFTVRFNKAVTGFDVGDITATSGTVQSFASSSPTAYTFEVSGSTNQVPLTVSIAAGISQDGDGNTNRASNVISLDIDRAVPMVSSASAATPTSITLTISKSVSGTDITPTDFTISGVGTQTVVTAVEISDTTITLRLSVPITDSDNTPTVSYTAASNPIADAAGNVLALFNAQSITNNLDTTAPTVSAISVAEGGAPSIQLETSEPIFADNIPSGRFTIGDVTPTPTVTAVGITNGTNTITLTLSSAISDADTATATVSFASGTNDIVDAAGNVLAAFDDILLDPSPFTTLQTDTTSPTNVDTISFTAQFSSDVTGFVAGDIRVSGTDLGFVYSDTIGMTGQLGSADGEFNGPRAIMQHSNGNIYVVESTNTRVQIFDGDTGQYIAKFGSSGSDNSQFDSPTDIIQHSNGNIYIVDSNNDRVQIFDGTTHAYIDKFGSSGSGNGQFTSPGRIMQHSNGNIYVVDFEDSRVQIFDGTTHAYIDKFGSSGSGNGQLTNPESIMQHSNGNIYIVDTSNDRVQIFNGTTHTYISQFGSSGSGNGQFSNPANILQASNGDIYVSDTSNHNIQVFDGTTHEYKLQFGSLGSTNDQFNLPIDMIQASNGDIYVSDFSNHRVQILTPFAGTVQNFVSPSKVISHLQNIGERGFNNGQFLNPIDVATNSTDYIYVTDLANARIQIFDADGQYAGKFGAGGSGNGQFSAPQGIAIDSNDDVYVADFSNNRIQIFGSDGTYKRQIGVLGSGDGQFNKPFDVAINSIGNIYVTDSGNDRVQIFSSAGTYQGKFGSVIDGTGNGQFNEPHGIAIDSNDDVYVVDFGNDRIQIFGSDGTYKRQFGATGTANGQFDAPQNILIDSYDDIYVSDGGNDRIQIFDFDGTYQSKFGSVINGTGNGQFNGPRGIAIDSDENVYVVDGLNNRIQKFSSSSPTEYTFDVSDFVDQDMLTVSIPAGISQDGDGNTNRASNVISLGIDRVVPTVSSITAGSTTSIVIKVSETFAPETRMTSSGFTVSNVATMAAVSTVEISGTTITLTLSASMTDSDSPSLTYAADPGNPITDAAGNALASFSAQSVTNNLDTTIPIVSDISVAEGDAASIQLEISEPIFADNIPPGRFTIGGVVSPPTVNAVSITNGTNTITLTLSAAISDTDAATVTVSFTSGANDIVDVAGNVLVPFSDAPLDPSPVISLQTSATSPTNLDPIPFTVRFNKVVTGFDAGDITTTSGTVQSFASSSPTAYTFEILGSTNQVPLTVSIAAGISQDGDGNTNRASNVISLDIDRIVPTVSSASAATPTSITLTISKSVSGADITPTDFTISGVGTSPVVTAVEISDTTITLRLSAPITDSDNTPTVSYTAASNPITDAAGNVLALFNTQSITNNLDTTAPTVSITTSASDPTNLAIVPFTVEFSENVSGFDVDDITKSSGTVENLVYVVSPVQIFGGIGSTDGKFLSVFGIKTNSTGYVYVTDPTFHRIQIFDGDGVYQSQFGGSGTGDGKFNGPTGIETNSTGHVYVSDSNNNRVQIFDRNGVYQSQFGGTGSGDGKFSLSRYVETNSTGHVYVSDFHNHRVQLFDRNGVYQSQFGGSGTGDGKFNGPEGIAINSTGHVYVSDSNNNRVQIFDRNGVYQSQFGGSVDSGGRLDGPKGIETNSAGHVYVTDSGNNRVQIFDRNGVYQSQFGGSDDEGGRFDFPIDITISTMGDIYVSDSSNHRVHEFASQRGYTFDVADSADQTTLTVSIPAGAAQDVGANDNTASDIISLGIDRIIPIVSSATTETSTSVILTISKSVSGTSITSGDFTIASVDSSPTVSTVVVSGTTITLTLSSEITDSDSDAAPTVSYTSSGNTIADAAGNALAAFTAQSITNTIDTTAPTVTLSTTASDTTNLSLIPFTAQFSENISGFDTSDITVSSGTVQNLILSSSPSAASQYTFVVANLTDQATLTASIPAGAAQDARANDNTASNAISLSIDRIIPVVSSASATTPTSVTLTISKSVSGTGITPADFAIDNVATSTTVSAVVVSGSTITLTLSPAITDSDVTPTVSYTPSTNPIEDTAGNALASFSARLITNDLDTTRPTVSVATSVTGPTNADSIPFTVQFNEIVTGFDVSDITKSSGTVENFDSSHHLLTFDENDQTFPTGIAINSTGHIYVIEGFIGLIRIFDSNDQQIGEFGGGRGTGNGQFNFPTGIAINSTGHIYISDNNNDRIQIFSSDGTYLDQFGVTGSNDGEFDSSIGIAINSTGYIYVTDNNNDRIQIFDSDHTYQGQFGGVIDGTGDGEFNAPYGIAIDSDDNIYVTEFNNDRVQIFSNDGTYQRQFGSVINGTANGEFNAPTGIALDSNDNIYVSDSLNDRVQIFSNDGTYQRQFGGVIDGTGDGEFNAPEGIALDSNDNIYVSEVNNSRVQKFAPTPIHTFDITSPTDQETLTVSVAANVANDAAALGNTPSNVASLDIDRTAPTVLSASTVDNLTVRLVLSEPVFASNIAPQDFGITGVAGGDPTVSTVAITNNTSLITLTLSGPIALTDAAPFASYTKGSNSITDAAGNALVTFSTQSISNNLDTEAPTVTSVSAADPTTLTLTVSEPVSGDSITPTDFIISNVGTSTTVSAVVVSGTTITLTLSPAITDSDTASTVSYTPSTNPIEDAAGNALAAFTPRLITNTLDTTAPTVSVTTTASDPTNAAVLSFTVQFSENVSGFDTNDVTVSSGTVQNLTPESSSPPTASQYTFDVANSANQTTLTVSISAGAAQDAAANDNTASDVLSVGIDRVIPTISSAAVTSTTSVTLTVTETVSGTNIAPAEFAIANADSSPTVSTVVVSGTTITLTLSSAISGSDTAPTVSYTPSANTIADTAGNALAMFTAQPITNDLDAIAPTTTLTTTASDPTNAAIVPFTVQFSENVSGFDAGDITVSSGTIQNLIPTSPSPPVASQYTFDVANSANQTTLTVSIPAGAAQDSDANNNILSNVLSVGIDRVIPVVSSAVATSATILTITTSETVSGTNITPTDFTIADVNSSPTVSTVVVSGSIITLTLSSGISGSDAAPTVSYIPSANTITDDAGNTLAAFTAQSITNDLDTMAPTVAITTIASSPTNDDPIPFIVRFSETVTGFDATDITKSSGTIQDFGSNNYLTAFRVSPQLRPYNVAINSTDHVYTLTVGVRGTIIDVFDSDDRRVLPQSVIKSYGTAADQLRLPRSMLIDSDGSIYITDTLNARIQKFNSNFQYIGQFGMRGIADGNFRTPDSIAINSTGHIFVTDFDRDLVNIFSVSGNVYTYQGQIGGVGNGTANGEFNGPRGIVIDSDDIIYIADSLNDRVQIFNSNGTYQRQIGGAADSTTNGQFDAPIGIALDSDNNIYVTEFINDRVQVFDNDGTYQKKISGVGSGRILGEFVEPRGIAVASDGDVYVADSRNERIQKLSQTPTRYTFDIAGPTDQETLTISIPANAADNESALGNTPSDEISLAIDRTAPTVSSAATTTATSVTLTVSESVSGTRITPGDFTISSVTTTTTVSAVVVSGSTITLTLSVPIVGSDSPTVSYSESSRSISDDAGNTLAAFGPQNISNGLDSTAPTVILTSTGLNPTNAAAIPFTVQFSENVSGFDASDITVSSGTIQNLIPASPSPPVASQYTFNVANSADQASLTVSIPAGAAQDAATNGNTASNTVSVGIDRTAPALSSATVATPTSITLIVSESVSGTGITAGDFTISSVATAIVVSTVGVSGSTITLTLSVPIIGSDTPTVSYTAASNQISDAAGNALAAFGPLSISNGLDSTAPTVTSASAATPTSVTLTVSESVTGPSITLSDFTIGDVATATTVSNIAISGTTITLTLSVPIVGSDSPTVSYSAAASAISDAAGNALAAFGPLSISNGLDSTAPTVTSASAATPTSVTLTVSESVTGPSITLSDFTIGDVATATTVSNIAISGTTITLTLSVPIVGSDSPTVSYSAAASAISDAAGNALAAFGPLNISNSLDTTPPTVTSASVTTSTSITLTISESVTGTGVTPGDFTIAGVATATTVSGVNVSGTTITLTLSVPIIGSDTPTVSYTAASSQISDTAGNALATFSALSITNGLDSTPPTVTSASAASPTSVRLTLSESISGTGVTPTDFTISGVATPTTVSVVNISGTVITLTLSVPMLGSDAPTVSYTPTSNPISDNAGNQLAAFNTQSITNDIDNPPPIATLFTAVSDPTSTDPIPFIVQFSETVTGFDATDITKSSGTVENFDSNHFLKRFREALRIQPFDVAINSTGHIHILAVGLSGTTIYAYDSNDRRLSSYVIQGQSGTADGDLAIPRSMLIDSSDDIYVVDTNNDRVQKFNSDGTYLAKFGSEGTGNGQFRTPDSIAINSTGYIYVTDSDRDLVHIFDSAYVYQGQLGGVGNSTANGEFNSPRGIVIDSNDNVYVTDFINDRVQIFDNGGTYQRQIGGVANSNATGQFNGPGGIALDSDNNIYVTELINDRVQVFDNDGTYQRQIGGAVDSSIPGQFNGPRGIAINSDGDIYVADSRNERTQKLSPTASRYTYDIAGSTDQATLTVSIPAGAAQDTDTNDNPISNVISLGIDRTAPTLSSAAATSTTSVALTISESVSGDNITPGDFTISGVATPTAVSTVNISGTVITLSLSVPIIGSDTPTVSYTAASNPISDAAGNVLATFTVQPITNGLDTAAPTISSASATTPTSVTLTISESVSGDNITPGDFTISGVATPTAVSTVNISGTVITLSLSVPITGSDAPTVSYTAASNPISDAAGNVLATFTAQSITNGLDTTAPTVTLSTDTSGPTNAATIQFTAQFSENVSGFDIGDIAVSSGTVQNLIPASPSPPAASLYTFDVANPANQATLTVSIPAGAAQDADANGNVVSDVISLGIDRTTPTVSSVAATSTTSITLTISESVSGTNIAPGDFVIANVNSSPTVTAVVVSGSTITLTLSAAISDSDATPTVSYTSTSNTISDAAGNTLATFGAQSITNGLDTTAPTAALSTGTSGPTNVATISFTVQFSENVSGFDAGDITVSSGTIQNLTLASSPPPAASQYTFDVANSADQATLTVSIPAGAAQDAATNGNVVSNTISIDIDRTTPTVSSAAATSTMSVTLTVSESVSGTDIAPTDFVIANVNSSPTVSDAVVSGSTITLTLSAEISGSDAAPTVSYTPSSNTISDAAGNTLATFDTQSITNNLDTETPSAVLSTSISDPTSLTVISFTVQFSENVSGFDAGDITVSSGTPQNLAPTSPSPPVASQYTFDVADPTDQATLTVRILADAVQDADTNSNTVSNAISLDIDRTVPTVSSISAVNTISVAITISETVYGTNIAPTDFVIANVNSSPTVSAVDVSGSTITLTLSAEISDSDTNPTVSYTPSSNTISDAAGNSIAAFAAQSISNGLDTRPPTVIIATSATDPTNVDPVPFTITFSEPVIGFAIGDITATSGTVQNLSPTPSQSVTSYTFTVAGPADGSVLTVSMSADTVQDLGGNANIASNPISLTIDTDPVTPPVTPPTRPTAPTRSGGGGGGGGGGESIPPSLTRSFDNGYKTITINNVGISPDRSGANYLQSPPISVSTGTQTSIQIILYENISWNLVSYVELCMNDVVATNQACDGDTKLIWDKSRGGNSLEIIDPHNIINDGRTSVDRTQVSNNVVTFDFDIEFAGVMDVSDLRIHTWDTNRNALVFTVEDAFEVVSAGTTITNDNNDDDTSTSTNDDTTTNDDDSDNNTDSTNNDNSSTTSSTATFDREILKQWTGFASKSISDTEFLTHVGIYNKDRSSNSGISGDDDVSLPSWTKNIVGKWALQGKISTDELKAVLSYVHDIKSR